MENKNKEDATSIENKESLEHFKKRAEAFKNTVRSSMKLSEKTKRSTVMNHNVDDINKWMSNPSNYENQLRSLSQYFYNTSSMYKLIIRYMALMPTYAYTLSFLSTPEKIDVVKAKKQFDKSAAYVDKLNIRHEMIAAMLVSFREDVFYGYEHETKDSFFIQQLDGKYCRISSKEDGVFNFAYDFSYFDTFKDELAIFPKEFTVKYNRYKNSSSKEKWHELDSNKTFCLKVNTDHTYPLPPFATMFQSIIDLDDYKQIKKDKAENDNFMAFIQRIPINEKDPDMNKFLIDLDLAMSFHKMAEDTLPEGVGVITSPMAIDAVKTEKRTTDSDVVNDAYREAFRDAGVSEFLFNSDKNTSIGLAKSIMTDEELIFSMLRQIERWLNRKLKRQSGAYKVKANFLDITIFNKDEQHSKYLESAQYGIPVIMEIGATLGLSPFDFMNKVTLESDILGLHDILKPLNSSFNKLENTEGGSNKLSDNKISDSGQKNRDADTDSKRN